MDKKNLEIVFLTLQKMFPENKTDLNYSTPFQLLMSVILSAQTTDKQVNKVTDTLFFNIKESQDILDMGFDNFKNSIKSIGLYNAKAKNIWKTSEILSKKDGPLPKDLIELQKFPGVGEKTAKVVSHILYGTPVVAVDTHVHRVVNRLGIVNTKSPIQTSKIIENKIPKKYLQIAHHGFIFFGRYHCLARNPKCKECPFLKFCKYFKQMN